MTPAAVLALCALLVASGPVEGQTKGQTIGKGPGWDALRLLREAYRGIRDVQFAFDAWLDRYLDGSTDYSLSGTALFRLHENTYIYKQRRHMVGGPLTEDYQESHIHGLWSFYRRNAAHVQGVLHRQQADIWLWGGAPLTVLFAPLLMSGEPDRYVALLVAWERVQGTRCARVVIKDRRVYGDRKFREWQTLAVNGPVSVSVEGENYWIDLTRAAVLQYERIAPAGDGASGAARESVALAARVRKLRTYRVAGRDVAFPTEVVLEVAPSRRGKRLVLVGHRKRIVVIPDSVQFNVDARDEAFVIDPPPGTVLQEPLPEPPLPDYGGTGKPLESGYETVPVPARLVEEADRQLAARGLEPLHDTGSNLIWLVVGAVGCVLILAGLWLRWRQA